jgi:small subunit ribosomal protein S8
MSLNDPLGDMLTRIRNGLQAGMSVVRSPSSNHRNDVLETLKKSGFIRDYKVSRQEHGQAEVAIELKYHDGQPVIREIKRVSKPGRRVYAKVRDFKPVYNGLGVAIVSTPKGVMTDHEARAANLGGEILCTVF